MQIAFDNSFAALPDGFAVQQDPEAVASPTMIKLNRKLAEQIGLSPDALDAAMLSGNKIPLGAAPIAMAYAGHQFGGFVPQLGDGRAVLLGEVVGPDGVRRDIQLKGSGRTPFSRNGDGRAVLGAVLREYIVSEAMAALGIPTTRALAAVATGQRVQRETGLPGAVLTRVAASHLRVGTFQFHAARQDKDALTTLTDYALARHYPAAVGAENAALALLENTVSAQADLIARWMGVGFIHGVMNTDNMTISGETIDFGPCAFLEEYHPDTVFSSIDRHGRYAFANQPKVGHWNLAQLAGALLPIIDADEDKATEQAIEILDRFPDLFTTAYFAVFGAKFGFDADREDDRQIIVATLGAMATGKVDFTLFFRHLTQLAEGGSPDMASLFSAQTLWPEVAGRIKNRWAAQGGADLEKMRRANPIYIPRNHRVEQAIEAANMGDFAPFETLVSLLERPFEEQNQVHFEAPAKPEEVVHQTFCGT